MKALSIRQPWAWLIVAGHKSVENRTWPTNRRGRFLIHAIKGMTNGEYDDVEEMLSMGPSLRHILLPDRKLLERGGIVGIATLTGCVAQCDSPFFFGPYGFMLADVKPLPFVEFKGMLGFFDVPDQLVTL